MSPRRPCRARSSGLLPGPGRSRNCRPRHRMRTCPREVTRGRRRHVRYRSHAAARRPGQIDLTCGRQQSRPAPQFEPEPAVDDVVHQVSPCHSYRVAFWSMESDPCVQVADYCTWLPGNCGMSPRDPDHWRVRAATLRSPRRVGVRPGSGGRVRHPGGHARLARGLRCARVTAAPPRRRRHVTRRVRRPPAEDFRPDRASQSARAALRRRSAGLGVRRRSGRR